MPKRKDNPNPSHDNRVVNYNKAIELHKNKDYAKALRLINKVIEGTQNRSLKAIELRASINHYLHLHQNAFNDANEVLLVNKFNTRCLNIRGKAYMKQGKHDPSRLDEALLDLSESIRLLPNPSVPLVYNLRGALYRRLGEWHKAIADFDQAIRINEDCHFAFSRRGHAYMQLENFDQALSDINRAIELQCSFFALSTRAQIQFGLDNLDDALRDFTRAIALKPAKAAPFLRRAHIYYKQGNIEAANIDLQNGFANIKNNPKQLEYYTELQNLINKALEEKNIQKNFVNTLKSASLTFQIKPPVTVTPRRLNFNFGEF